MDDRRGSFNLKVVVRETGLKPDTLRAWERRYGVPRPKRTSGGHRLYSQRDIDCLRWLAARQAEGLSISRAVELWRGLEGDGLDPLQAPAYAIPGPPDVSGTLAAGEAIVDLREAWLKACAELNEPMAEQILQQALALYPPETVCFEVLGEGLAQIGQGWYQGRLSVQQEHFASELAHRRLEALLLAAAPPTRRSRFIVACPPQEQHTFAPLLLTLLLRRRGYAVTYLGADVPLQRMAEVLETTKPHLVLLAAQRLETAAGLRAMASDIAEQRVSAAFGGLIFVNNPQMIGYVPGHYLGDRLEQAPQAVERLLSASVPPAEGRAIPAAYRRASTHFRSHRTRIDADAWASLEPRMDTSVLVGIRDSLGNAIQAALEFGDLNLVRGELHWVAGLLAHRGGDARQLTDFLVHYRQAALRHLDDSGRPVLEWLERIVAEAG